MLWSKDVTFCWIPITLTPLSSGEGGPRRRTVLVLPSSFCSRLGDSNSFSLTLCKSPRNQFSSQHVFGIDVASNNPPCVPGCFSVCVRKFLILQKWLREKFDGFKQFTFALCFTSNALSDKRKSLFSESNVNGVRCFTPSCEEPGEGVM